jgi:release factor glutamine methyltransferase
VFLKDLINKGAETVSKMYPEREAREMVFAFLEHHIGTRRHTHIVEPGYEVSDEDACKAVSAFERMASGEPLQYVTGKADFYGRDFHVTPSVLIPRPETELLCRMALDVAAERQIDILDLCTGSGCIAWTVALECPQAKVTAVDISDGALDVAVNQDFTEELSRTGAKAPVFCKADVLAGPEAFCRADRKYDLILSNPPYVMDKEKALMRTNVLEHEPHLALFVSDDDPLVFYRAVAAWASALLAPDGTGIVEINEALGPETAKVFLDAGFSSAEIVKDLSERDRFVVFSR